MFGGWPYLAFGYAARVGGVWPWEAWPYCAYEPRGSADLQCWPCMADDYSIEV